jgi:hypothetical protein
VRKCRTKEAVRTSFSNFSDSANQKAFAYWGMVLNPILTPNKRMVPYTGVLPNEQVFQEGAMQCIGIDLHTNRFTCCYRDEKTTGAGAFAVDAGVSGLYPRRFALNPQE